MLLVSCIIKLYGNRIVLLNKGDKVCSNQFMSIDKTLQLKDKAKVYPKFKNKALEA